ncbi:RNA methyltransferase [soil metagenome]
MTQPVAVTDPSDACLADFTALNEPVSRRRVERQGGYFVVEGIVAIERLLTLPRWQIRSLALLPRVADRLGDRLADLDVAVLVAEEAVLRAVVGFDLHRGALASVARQPVPESADLGGIVGGTELLLVAEGVSDHANLGALYRNAAAFGVGAVLLDPTCADPFYRRSVRVSAGHVLAVPTGRLDPLPDGLARLHALGVTTVALTPSADHTLRQLRPADRGDGPVALVVGAEGPGLTGGTLAAAQHRVAIAMADGVDSLNVATATAIALHHLRG